MKMLQGNFTLDDFLEQIRMIQKMGSLKDIVGEDARHERDDARRTSTSTTASS